jgi:hypothetical protein
MIHHSFVRSLGPLRLGGGTALGALLVLLAASAAIASIPDSSGVIHGCYGNVVGFLRIIDSDSQSCLPYEKAISWSQTGPQGPPGPPGMNSGQGKAVTLTQEMDVPCDGSWHAFSTSPIAVGTTGSQTVLLSGYFQSGPISTPPGSIPGYGTGPQYSGRFVVDGSPLGGSVVSGSGTPSVSFSHALTQAGGSHSFTMEVSCPTQVYAPSGSHPVLPVYARTLAVQNLG